MPKTVVTERREFVENFVKENEGIQVHIFTKKYTTEINIPPLSELKLLDVDVNMYYRLFKHVDAEVKDFLKEQERPETKEQPETKEKK